MSFTYWNRQPRRSRLTPAYDRLESRELLSAVDANEHNHKAVHTDLLMPPVAEVSVSNTILSKSGGSAFARFSADLASAEQASHVTPGEFTALEYYASQLDKAIEAANMSSSQMQRQLFELQDVIDTAFLGGSFTKANWSNLQHQMSKALSGISVTSPLIPQTLSGAVPLSSSSSQTVRNTFTEMRVVGREAHVTEGEHQTLIADEKALYSDIMSGDGTNVGASTPRDPIEVYYDGQVLNFVHAKD